MTPDDAAEQEKITKKYREIVQSFGVQPIVTSVYASALQGITENRQRQLRRVTSALLFSARLSDKWWCDAWRWSAQLINLRPISSLQITVKELEELKKKDPNKYRKFKKPFNISPYYALYQEPRDIRNFTNYDKG